VKQPAAGEVVEPFYRLIGLPVAAEDLPILTEMLERHMEAFRQVEEMETAPSLTFRADWE
jgi:hypothetical protein